MTNHKRILTIEETICNYYEIQRENLYKPNRLDIYVRARYLIWHYAKTIFDIKITEVARHYHKHHTSVMHGLKSVQDSIDTKQYLYHDLTRLDPIMTQIGQRLNMKVIIEVETGTNWRSMITDISEKYNVINYQVV